MLVRSTDHRYIVSVENGIKTQSATYRSLIEDLDVVCIGDAVSQ